MVIYCTSSTIGELSFSDLIIHGLTLDIVAQKMIEYTNCRIMWELR